MRAQELQYRFKQRNAKTQTRVRELMEAADREVRQCDPADTHATGLFHFKTGLFFINKI